MPTDFRRGVAWSLAAALGAGAFVIPWKLANEAGSAATSTLVLLVAAALLNTTLLAAQRWSAPAKKLTRLELGMALVLAALTLFGNLASATAIQTLSPSLLNVLMRGDVLAVALLAWLLLGERVERRFWLGAAIAGGGLVLVQGSPGGATSHVAGTGYALLAVLFFSSMAVVTRRVIHRVDPVRVNALRLWMSLPLWFLVSGVPDELFTISRAQLGYASLAALAGPFAARLCMMFSARHVDARITALGVLTAPAITLALEVLILGDVPPRRELLGGAIMIAGIALPLLGHQLRRRRRG